MGLWAILIAVDGRKRVVLIAALLVLLALSLAILLLFNVAAQYDPLDNQAAEAFLFTNAVIVAAVTHHFLMSRIGDAGEAMVDKAVRKADARFLSDRITLTERIVAIRKMVWTSMVLVWPLLITCVLVAYLAVLSSTSLVFVAGGIGLAVLSIGAIGVRSSVGVAALPSGSFSDNNQVMPAWAIRAFSDFHSRMTKTVFARWRWTMAELSAVSMLGILVAGLVAIAVPVLDQTSSETAIRLVVTALTLWCLFLGLGGYVLKPSWFSILSDPSASPLVIAPAEPVSAQWTRASISGLLDADNDVPLELVRKTSTVLVGDNSSGITKLFRNLALPSSTSTPHISIDEDSPLSEIAVRSFQREAISIVQSSPLLWTFALPDVLKHRVQELSTLVGVPAAVFDVAVTAPQALGLAIRRRLALVLALFEQRPILLLEDYLDGQDQTYTDFFFQTTLPFLCSMGVCVVVTTTDRDNLSRFDRSYLIENQRIKTV